jgi:hypothetical protein
MTNQTTTDNNRSASDRTIPQELRQYQISISGTDIEQSDQFADVKSATIISDEPINFNLSYDDGGTDNPGDLLTIGTDTRILYHPGGNAAMFVAQETEFNSIHAEITAGSGSATVRIMPGGGITQ